jgi:beta-mannanase
MYKNLQNFPMFSYVCNVYAESGSQEKSHQLIDGYGRQFETERNVGFTEVGVERQEDDVNKNRSHGHQTVQKRSLFKEVR